jgi:precorrin-6B methylase 2
MASSGGVSMENVSSAVRAGQPRSHSLFSASDVQNITLRYNQINEKMSSSQSADPGSKIEVEARFSNVTQAQFDNLHAALGYPPFRTSIVELSGGIRRITMGSLVQWEEKRDLSQPIFIRNNEGKDVVKISFATETPIAPPANFIPRLTRSRSRASVDLSGARVDLTEVLVENDRNVSSQYEVEVEMTGPLTAYLSAVNEIWLRLIFTSVQVGRITSDIETVFRTGGSGDKFARSILVEARNIKPRDLVWGGIVGPNVSGETRQSQDFQGFNPGVQYGVTLKADGTRRLLLLHQTGVWLVYPPHVYQYLGPLASTLSSQGKLLIETAKSKYNLSEVPVYLFDCELVSVPLTSGSGNVSRLLVFDTLIWTSRDVRKIPMIKVNSDPATRLAYSRIAPSFFSIQGYTVETKEILPIVTPTDVFTLSRQLLESDPGYPTDGLMFTPLGVEYNPRSSRYLLSDRVLTSLPDVCKWKPPEKITIDFEVRYDSRTNPRTVLLFSQGSGRGQDRRVLFTGSEITPLTPDMILDIPTVDTSEAIENGDIVEYAFVGGKMTPIRKRPDKLAPNYIDIANDNWKDIQDPVSMDWITGKSLDPAIWNHKSIKRSLLNSIEPGSYILDIGSGRGGDIRSWAGKRLRVLAVEPNPEHIEILRSRAEKNKFTNYKVVETVGQDSETIVSALYRRVDYVTLMLSLSFFWRSETDLDALTQTLVQSIGYGGKIIFLTINGDAVSEIASSSFTLGGARFSMPDSRTLDIDMPGTIVGQQREYLVFLSDLTSKLASYGIVLREHYRATSERVMPLEASVYSGLYSYGYYEHDGSTILPGPLPANTTRDPEMVSDEIKRTSISTAPSIRQEILPTQTQEMVPHQQTRAGPRDQQTVTEPDSETGRVIISPLGNLYLIGSYHGAGALLSSIMATLPDMFQGFDENGASERIADILEDPNMIEYGAAEGAARIRAGDPIGLDLVQHLALAIGRDILVWTRRNRTDDRVSALGSTGLGLPGVVMVLRTESDMGYGPVGIPDSGQVYTDIVDPNTISVLLSAF